MKRNLSKPKPAEPTLQEGLGGDNLVRLPETESMAGFFDYFKAIGVFALKIGKGVRESIAKLLKGTELPNDSGKVMQIPEKPPLRPRRPSNNDTLRAA